MAHFTQFFPPTPTLTEANLPSQSGKVFLVTGGTSGVGYELASILYGAGAKVYITARSDSKAERVIREIRAAAPDESQAGQIEPIHTELDDLATVKPAAEAFLARESKLHGLWNNAGISLPPDGSKSKQGYDLMMSTNCLGHLLLTRLLAPALKAAAQDLPPACVRVVWSSTQMVELSAPWGGFDMQDVRTPPAERDPAYIITKTGNWFLASEVGREVAAAGILSVAHNPGAMNTPLLDNLGWKKLLVSFLLYKPRVGACTLLWCGVSPELTMEDNGGFMIPFGRRHPGQRVDLLYALKGKEEGGTGLAREFIAWCDEQIAQYL